MSTEATNSPPVLPAPDREQLLMDLLQDNIFPIEILGPQTEALIHQAKEEICADKRYAAMVKSGITPEMMIKAAVAYSITGSARKAGQMVGVPDHLINRWKYRPFWGACLRVARYYNTIDSDISVRQIRSKALRMLEDRMSAPGMETKDILQAIKVTDHMTAVNDKRLNVNVEDTDTVKDSLEQIKDHMRELSVLYKARDITKEAEAVRVGDWSQITTVPPPKAKKGIPKHLLNKGGTVEEGDYSAEMRRKRKGQPDPNMEYQKATLEEAESMLQEMGENKEKQKRSTTTRGRLSGRSKQIDDAVNSQTGRKKKY